MPLYSACGNSVYTLYGTDFGRDCYFSGTITVPINGQRIIFVYIQHSRVKIIIECHLEWVVLALNAAKAIQFKKNFTYVRVM